MQWLKTTISLYLMILWLKHLSKAWQGDFPVPCGTKVIQFSWQMFSLEGLRWPYSFVWFLGGDGWKLRSAGTKDWTNYMWTSSMKASGQQNFLNGNSGFQEQVLSK